MDSTRHQDRVCIVTGGGSGIGQATVLRLAQEGAQVVAFDIDEEGLGRTEALLADAGLKATFLRADVTDDRDLAEVVSAASLLGPIDLVANVAGVGDHFQGADEIEDAIWDLNIAVNLTGPMKLCRQVIPLMKEAGGGSIVNVVSVAGYIGGAGGTPYTAAKHGLLGLTRSIAFLYQPDGIRCNAVCPGNVQTGIWRTAKPKSYSWVFDRIKISMRRNSNSTDPDNIASLISWLGSSEAVNLNGAIVAADGGWSAG